MANPISLDNFDRAQRDALYDQWRTEGYAFVPQLISAERAARLREISDDILAQWRANDPQTGQPGDKPDATVMRHLNHPAYFQSHAEGLNEILEMAADPRALDVVETILGERPMFRCTSLFFNPSGVELEGNWHRDSQFMTPDDPAEQKMVADAGDGGSGMQFQIALLPSEDIELVPGSHLRWDTPEEYAIRKAERGQNNRSNNMPGAVRVRQQAGDAILFNPMGLHRGRYRASIPRRTLMLTYTKTSEPWFDYFSNQPWFSEPDYLANLNPETRAFYEPFVAQYAPKWSAEKTIP